MNIGYYSREQIAYRSAGATVFIGAVSSPVDNIQESHQAVGDQVQFSNASQAALRAQSRQMEFSGGWNDLRLDKQGNILAEASYNVKFSSKFESLNMSFTFTAESLGLRKEDFAAFGGKPFEIKLDLFQQSLDYIKEREFTITQESRSADEIIIDIARSLRDVFKQKGDETVKLHLDKEAFQALIGNAGTSNLVDDIVALIGIINNSRLYGGPRDHYDIYVSGKGKPKMSYKENVELNLEGSQISLSITILPPEESASATESDASAKPALEASQPISE